LLGLRRGDPRGRAPLGIRVRRRWEFEYDATLRVRFHETCERVWEEALGLDQGE